MGFFIFHFSRNVKIVTNNMRAHVDNRYIYDIIVMCMSEKLVK